MNNQDLLELYEKQYFYELDRKDDGVTKFQLLFAMLVAQYSVLVFLIDKLIVINCGGIFHRFLFLGALLFTILASLAFKKAWHGNRLYSFLPMPEETEGYQRSLEALYAPYEEKAELIKNGMKNYIRYYFIECTTTNTEHNDKKAIYRNKTSKHLMVSFIFSIICAFAIYFSMLSLSNVYAKYEENLIKEVINVRGKSIGKQPISTGKPATATATATARTKVQIR